MEPQRQISQLPVRVTGSYLQTKFKPVTLLTNMFSVKVCQFKDIHIFSFKITPRVMEDDTVKRSRIFQEIFPDLTKQIRLPVLGGMNIYSLQEPLKLEQSYKSNGFYIEVRRVKVMTIKDSKLLTNFLNNAISNMMGSMKYIGIGKSGRFYRSKDPIKINRVSIYRGYRINFVNKCGGIFLRVNNSHKVIQNISILDFVSSLYKLNDGKTRDEKRQLTKESLINKVVRTNYGKIRYARIIDVQFLNSKEELIHCEDGSMTIYDYYLKKYNIKITKEKQPLLVIENKNKKHVGKTYLVAQLCNLTGIPQDDDFLHKQVCEKMKLSSQEKLQNTQNLITQITGNIEFKSLVDMGINISEKPQKIKAYLIPKPAIKFGNDECIESIGKPTNVTTFEVYKKYSGLDIGLISFESLQVTEMVRLFQKYGQRMRVGMRSAKFNLGSADDPRKMSSVLKSELVKVAQKGFNMVIVILPHRIKDRYKQMKTFCLENKMNSQFIHEATLKKSSFQSIMSSIFIQMASKVGNPIWAPLTNQIFRNGTVIMGFQTHKKGKDGILTGISSLDCSFTEYWTQSAEFVLEEQKFMKMRAIFTKLITKYCQLKKKNPKHIIIFVRSLNQTDIKIFQQYFTEKAYQDLTHTIRFKIKMTVILVGSKSSQNFYGIYNNKNETNTKRIDPGTVINEKITSGYQFYLSSTNKGAPTHYKVIFNNSFIQEGLLYELIYSQCFNYVNWNDSIKVPAVLQYARKCSSLLSMSGIKNLNDFPDRFYYI